MYFTRMNWKLALWLAVMLFMLLACLPEAGPPPPLPLGDALYSVEPHDIYRAIEAALTSTDGIEAGILIRESEYAQQPVHEYIFWQYHGDEMRMAYTSYIEGQTASSIDVAIDGCVVDAQTGKNWLKELGTRGFWVGTADQVVQYFQVFKAYSATIINQTTQIWPTVIIVPAALFQESYIDQKLAPMDT